MFGSTRSRPHDLLTIVLALLMGAVAVACDFRERRPSSPTTVSRDRLPPNDVDALAAMYDDELEPFGLRLTRGALVDTSNDSYNISDTGTHLALYVEPVGTYPPARYLENLVPVAGLFATDVFERWPGLHSFDVCQEPPPDVDADDEPKPDTQVNVTRAQSEALDWATLDNVELLSVAIAEPPGAELVISDRIRDLPEYEDLQDDVERATGVRPS